MLKTTDGCQQCEYSRDLRPAKWGSEVQLHCGNLGPAMSLMGQKRPIGGVRAMPLFPQKRPNRYPALSDAWRQQRHFARRQNSPLLFDQVVGAGEQSLRN